MKTIKNTKAAGKFASGFRYTVLELIPKEDGGITLDFAVPLYISYRPGKMNGCIMKIESGCIYSGYAKRAFSWVGDAKQQVMNASYVDGVTYELREELSALGFSWNGKRWEK